jgi:hypothetical protein
MFRIYPHHTQLSEAQFQQPMMQTAKSFYVLSSSRAACLHERHDGYVAAMLFQRCHSPE